MMSAVNDHRRQQLQQPPAATAAAEVSPRRAAGLHQHQQPTRIKSFLRQNQNNAARKFLLPTLYLSLAVLYFRGLLPRDVGSSDVDGKSPRHNHHRAPEPRSLADVTIANAEAAWRRREDHKNYLRRRAEIREEERRKSEEALRLARERKENATLAVAGVAGGGDVTTTGGRRAGINASEQLMLLKMFNDSDSTAAEFDAEEYVKRLATLSVQRTPRRRKFGPGQGQGGGGADLGFLPVLFVITTCTLFRICVNVLIGRAAGIDLEALEDDDADDRLPTAAAVGGRRGGLSSFSLVASRLSGGPDAARLRRRQRAEHARRQFRRFADGLNAEREANGERRISTDTLRHLVNPRDFDGNDYDRLSSFVEENGPAMGSYFSAIGATDAEIGRCPSRAIGADDDLLRSTGRATAGGRQQQGQTCSICLEHYQVGETVRTIPCFHTFHMACIDPWLAQRAECPVCKHSAIG